MALGFWSEISGSGPKFQDHPHFGEVNADKVYHKTTYSLMIKEQEYKQKG
jgi:hypothetical protein